MGALVAVSLRRVPVAAVVAGGLLSGVVLLVPTGHAATADELLPAARLASILVAASTAGVVVDPSAALTDTTWRGRRRRIAFVLAPTMALAGAIWVTAAIIAERLVGAGRLPLGGLAIELAALIVVCWALTAILAQTRGTRGAPLAGATCLMVAALGTTANPHTIEWLWRSPDPGWLASHMRWTAIGVAGVAGLAAVWRDPGR